MTVALCSVLPTSDVLLAGLGAEGIRVDLIGSLAQVDAVAEQAGRYDAILLDVPELRGAAHVALRTLRRRGLQVPVLVICDAAAPEERPEAYDLGADDVVTRNVGAAVVAARLRAAQRRCLASPAARLSCGNVVLEQKRQQVLVDGRPVRLTTREFEVLEMLMLRRGTLQTKDYLMSRLYGDLAGPEHRILEVFICKLRRKLAMAGAAEIINTVWGQGYVVEDPVAAIVPAVRVPYATHRAPLAHAPVVPASVPDLSFA